MDPRLADATSHPQQWADAWRLIRDWFAIEHGLEICSADTDFARFTEVRWSNPIAD